MIGVPFDNNDLTCLGAITEVVANLVGHRDPLLMELAAKYPTTEALAGWIRSLPQRDDEGIASDGPKVEACEPRQRLRIPAPDPNCVERAALYLGVAELIDPWPVRQLATLDLDWGRHTFPIESGAPIVLDPRVTSEALAHGLAQRNQVPPVSASAAAMAILMGMRASEITNRTVRDVDDGGRVLWISRAKTPRGNRHLKVPTVLQPRLVELCARRFPAERLFGEGRDRHWVYYHVQRICRLAKVPVVCTQGLRGTQSTISIEAVSVEHVAAALGQKGPRVTRRAYLAPGAEQSSRARKVEQLITGAS